MTLVLAVIALVLSVAALAVAYLGRSRATGGHRRAAGDAETPEPVDTEALRDEVAALRADARQTLRHLAVIRYDAFGDMGGQLSWSIALLDDVGDGFVLTSIHGRNEARTYAKNISEWTCDQQLSPEEEEAITTARPS